MEYAPRMCNCKIHPKIYINGHASFIKLMDKIILKLTNNLKEPQLSWSAVSFFLKIASNSNFFYSYMKRP